MGEPALNLNEVLTISVGRSRKETNWKQVTLTWSQLVDRLRTPKITSESVEAFHNMPYDQQQEIKDVGGYVGGVLAGGSRSVDDVLSRDVIAWDADYGDMGIWDTWDMMVGKAAVIHSSHKHTPEHPRLRIVAPLKRTVTPLEYEAIGRRIAEWMDIEAFDDTTYEVNRLMFWPSHPADGEYVFEECKGDWLDPDEILATYKDWHDMREWPVSSRKQKAIRKMGEKQGDPLTKPGVIGAFNRAYTITEALVKFLPGVYTPSGGNRWTYAKGSTVNGAIVYDDDTFFYSHHGTDPISERLCNAFDLVRLHKFGDLDAGQQCDLADMPSQHAMRELCAQDEKVRAELDKAVRRDPTEMFSAPEDNLERFSDDLTEQGAAIDYADTYRHALKFSAATSWMFWNGQIWELKADSEAQMLAMQFTDLLYGQARVSMQTATDKPTQTRAKAEMQRATRLRTAKGLKALTSIAASMLNEPRPEEYDADGWILNTPDGIVDLKTGQLMEHDPDARCTKITACGLQSTSDGVKMWADFVKHITGGDVNFAKYLQTLAGMAAVGEVYEEGLVISYGPGGNGKSTFFGALGQVLGDYAKTINADLLVPVYGHPDLSYVATLRGVRLAVMGETEENARMSISLMKRITSRDRVTGRALYKDPIEFTPAHTTIMHTNHLPRLNSLDGGTKRRIAIAPFMSKLPPEDVITDYERVLVEECGGAILQWIVDGAVLFYNSGCKLPQPDVVRKATEEYINSEDAIQQWIDECCEKVEGHRESPSLLYTRFAQWAKTNGLWERSQTIFGRTLTDKGFELIKSNGKKLRVGLKLNDFE